ncbi:MDR family oxidoreductase [Caballeronia sp. dw_19]|uniref:MDR family oxidoreductase n=1 Tax=Caballeronia sp. dw_19 TaxID=2719791 RepID=UPI001BD34B98|nr:MDR family oxidoreductase [Caballeronia sp. dw_19]
MSESRFRALLLRRSGEQIEAAVEHLDEDDLPAGDVLVRVRYSDVNYKDGLAITGTGHRQVVQHFPFVPGIDFAGVVERSDSDRFRPGDEVVLTGWGVGEKHWGGFAEKARVSAEWLVPLPTGMTMRQAMAYGTAGLSAMLCVDALERHGIDPKREVLVTGAGGGVGSVALLLLHRLGYHVVASSGRPEQEAYLRSLGAQSLVGRSTLAEPPAQPLLPERWGGVIDNVGGTTLAHALAGMAYGGAIASLGLVGGRDLNTTVLPFIMRGVALLGVDSVYCPTERRITAWRRLAELIPDGLPGESIEEIGLDELPARAAAIMKGHVRGRTIVAL